MVTTGLFLGSRLTSAQFNIRIIPDDDVEDILRLPAFDKFYNDMTRVIVGWRTTHRFGPDFILSEKVGETDREEVVEEASDDGVSPDFSRLDIVYRPVQLSDYPSYQDRVNSITPKILMLTNRIWEAEGNTQPWYNNDPVVITLPDASSGTAVEVEPWDPDTIYWEFEDENTIYGLLNSLRWNIKGWKNVQGSVNRKFYSARHRLDWDEDEEDDVDIVPVIDKWISYMANKVFLPNDFAWFADWVFDGENYGIQLPNGAPGYRLDYDSANELVNGLSNLGDALFKLRSDIVGRWENVLEMISDWSDDPLVMEIGTEIAAIDKFWKFYQTAIVDIGMDLSEVVYASRGIPG
ncbi:hypothetical protein TWF694_010120 [Orbilia ellipsospora]|uniref:Uncharacterized protein n=1 Tax=Orbilia ellipsospora TaxID=2528407 RepID=A0AAV9XA83_9PEZI